MCVCGGGDRSGENAYKLGFFGFVNGNDIICGKKFKYGKNIMFIECRFVTAMAGAVKTHLFLENHMVECIIILTKVIM